MLDQIVGQLGEKFGLGDKAGDLVGMLMQHVQGKGGLGNLMQGFQAQGLGKEADSWVSTGSNLPINPDQLKSVLGNDVFADIAGKLGIAPEQAANAASEALPQVVDKMTPDGNVPEGGDIMGQLKNLMGGADLGNVGGMLGGLLGDK